LLQRKSGCRWGQACPASLSKAKSAEAENGSATQHRPKQLAQSASRFRRARPRKGSVSLRFPDKASVLLLDQQRSLVVRLPDGSALPALPARGGTRAVSCGLAWSRLDRLAERGGWCLRRRSRR